MAIAYLYNEDEYVSTDIENEATDYKHCSFKEFKSEEKNIVINPIIPLARINNTSKYFGFDFEFSTKNLSPILSKFTFGNAYNELSPILSQNSRKPPSPIINKKKYLAHIRSRARSIKDICDESENYTDIFHSQIIENSSQDLHKHFKTSSQLTTIIEPLLSQDCTLIPSVDYLDETQTALYHNPPKCKRKYKKGGLASTLQKALRIQKTRVAIWQHEYETDKVCNVLHKTDKVIKFTITNMWEEYGNLMLQCLGCVYNDNSESTKCENSMFFVVIGCNYIIKSNWEIGHAYKIFPPFNVKEINYKLQKYPCYFNISKHLKTVEKNDKIYIDVNKGIIKKIS